MENKKSRFEECLETVERRYKRLGKQLEDVRMFLGGRFEAQMYDTSLAAERTCERLTLLMRALPAYTGHPRARDHVERIIRQTIPVTIGFTEQGWLHVRMPILLPKKEAQSRDYIRSFLFPAVGDFAHTLPPIRYRDCILIYRHVYDRERPERHWRDHDNIEINVATDCIAFYFMPDDSPHFCRHYYCSAAGIQERTEVYIVPRADFGKWLEMEDSLPEEGLPLQVIPPWMDEKDM